MRETAATWAKRVREWKASGETSEKFSESREFSAGGLRHWAYRLRQTKRREPRPAALRLVRVDRAPVQGPPPAAGDGRTAARLHVEVAGTRVAVAPGFDRATLAAIIDVLEQRGRSGR